MLEGKEKIFMQVDLLCSGSKGNCCIVRDGQSQLMIDCGSTKKYLFQAMQDVNAKIEDCNGILITHAHVDHVSQLKHVNSQPVYSYCDLKLMDNHHRVYPNDEFDIGTFHVQVIRLSHDSPNTVGYVIQSQGEKLVYITDTGFIANANKPLIQNADYYVFESNHDVEMLMQTNRPLFLKQRILSAEGHLNNEDSAANLSEIINVNTKQIVLAHLSQEANTPEKALETFHSTFLKKGMSEQGIEVRAAQQFEIIQMGK